MTDPDAAPRAEASSVPAVPIAAVAPALSKSSPLRARRPSIARGAKPDHKKRRSTPQGAKQPLPESGTTPESGGEQPLCHPNSPDSTPPCADAQQPARKAAEEQAHACGLVNDENIGRIRGNKPPNPSAKEGTVNNTHNASDGSAAPDSKPPRLRKRRKRESKGGDKPNKKKNRGPSAQASRATRKRPCRAVGLCCRIVLAFTSFCVGALLVLAPLAAFAPSNRARAGAVVETGSVASSLVAATLTSFSPVLTWARQTQDLAVEALQTGSFPARWPSRELDQSKQRPVGASRGGMWGAEEPPSPLSGTGYSEDDEDEGFEPSALAKFQDGVVQWLKSVAEDGQTSRQVDADTAPQQRSLVASKGSLHGRAPKQPVIASARNLFTGLTARLSKLYEDLSQHQASMAGPALPHDSSAVRTAVEQQRAAAVLPRLVVEPGTRLGRIKSMLDGNGPKFDPTTPWVTPSEH